MTSGEFSERIVSMMQTLYRISCSQLSQRCDRDDAVGECLLKAWQKRHQLRDERYMQTWVVRILINECHNINKKRSRTSSLDEIPDSAAPADADHELRDALLGLDESLRLPILLYYIEGYSVKEVAKILRIAQGTVKSRMSRGRQKLKEVINWEV